MKDRSLSILPHGGCDFCVFRNQKFHVTNVYCLKEPTIDTLHKVTYGLQIAITITRLALTHKLDIGVIAEQLHLYFRTCNKSLVQKGDSPKRKTFGTQFTYESSVM